MSDVSKPRFYVTTAIDYPNGAPHIGHVYEKLLADLYARWHRYLGENVYFLTGTDENGQKLVKAAAEAGASSTADYVDTHSNLFRDLCKRLKLSNNDFIRTTETRHAKTCHRFWDLIKANGFIYFDRYEGQYCYSCEAFYTEGQAESGNCPHHGKKLETLAEEGYFFKLSEFKDSLLKHFKENPDFVFPASARSEILSRLEKEGLRDLSITRPNHGWGIPVPDDDKYVLYTWFDALINYYTAVEHPDPSKLKFWPADMHVVGKDITWFHAVIWPAMLAAASIALPRKVHVHGMLLGADGRKMSKSLGNVVSPNEVLEKAPLDVLRYYMYRGIPSGGDGRFSLNDLVQRNNSELANDYGNLVSRVVKLALKRLSSEINKSQAEDDFDWQPTVDRVKDLMQNCEHNRALDLIWEGVGQLNAYLNKYEPWRIKDDNQSFHRYIWNALHGLYVLSHLLQAFLPESTLPILGCLGVHSGNYDSLDLGKKHFSLTSPEKPAFERIVAET